MQITPEEITETLAMVSKQHLDIRTITLGLNLRGCTHEDVNVMARKVYDRMTTAAEKLVPTAEQLEREYGIPIVNKRISVTPIAEICAATQATGPFPYRYRDGQSWQRSRRRFCRRFFCTRTQRCLSRRQQPDGINPCRPCRNR